ncbi:MAG: redoxin domain-containing protein [Planctomycetota bacterium]|nr:redoxin domain-containing protein [Planctomycetota bacterium]
MKPTPKRRLLPAFALLTIAVGAYASTATALSTIGDPKTDEPKKEEPKKGEVKKDEAWPTAESGTKAEIGKLAIDFTLKDIDGKDVKLSSFKGKTIVLEWFSPGCPACKFAYGKDGPLKEQHARLTKEGVVWLSMNSEDSARPASTVEANKAFLEKYKVDPRIVLDPSGSVGKAYGAKTTPHMFVIDAKGMLIYQGALDNAPGGEVEKDAKLINYVDAALKEVAAGKPVTTPKTTSYG